MSLPKLKQLSNLDENTKNKVKPVLIGALVLLLGAFGLTASNTNMDLNKLMSGSSVKDSMIKPTQAMVNPGGKGKLVVPSAAAGGVMSKIEQLKRDAQGKFLPENCDKNQYNCEDFKYQDDAQEVYNNCGGTGHDINRLDGNKDGVACESLPKRNK
jgi:hypothetical protein